MASFSWTSGPNSSANTLLAVDGSNSTLSYDALGGTDTFNFSYTISPSKFTLTKSTTGAITISGASNGHGVHVKLTNFENIVYRDSSGSHTLSIASIKAGTSGADSITGTAFADVINAAAGNDKLAGGAGNDVLTGGTGSDLFLFNAALNSSTNVDTVKDFVHGSDKIQLDDDIFTKLGVTGTTAGVALKTSGQFYASTSATAAHDADDRIIYNKTTGALYYDADGVGGSAAVKFAVIGTTTHPSDLAYTDFKVVA